jgi:metal-responsive CopG/Arc/MetJ family transcriptional regulator
MSGVRRINVHLDEDLDAELTREAARVGESKAALLRRAARALLDQRSQGAGDDSWARFTGAVRAECSDDQHDDDVLYR